MRGDTHLLVTSNPCFHNPHYKWNVVPTDTLTDPQGAPLKELPIRIPSFSAADVTKISIHHDSTFHDVLEHLTENGNAQYTHCDLKNILQSALDNWWVIRSLYVS